VDSTGALHEEAPLLDADELADAERALIEDGILAGPEWWQSHAVRRIEREAALRAATKYGWALLHLERMLRGAAPPRAVLWSLAGAESAATEAEAQWLACELARRGICGLALDLTWRFTIEPMVEIDPAWAEDFSEAWSRIAANFSGSSCRTVLPHAAGKMALLEAVARSGHEPLLDLRGLAWMGLCRVLAGRDAPLFREMLGGAQAAFVFDRTAEVLATSEDDVRGLPEAADAELEAMFLDDHRGRQLLHVTAGTLCADEALAPRITAALDAHRAEIERWIEDEVLALAAAWLEAPRA
jgi:hypothetical protein